MNWLWRLFAGQEEIAYSADGTEQPVINLVCGHRDYSYVTYRDGLSVCLHCHQAS